MTSSTGEYLEQQYSDFERSHLSDEHFWGAPVSKLTTTSLFSAFQQFRTLFPDHPDEDNTLFYILRGPRSDGYTALLVCLHFEHCSLDDVRALVGFLEGVATIVEHETSTLIDFLGGETLVARFCEPAERIVTLIQQHAT